MSDSQHKSIGRPRSVKSHQAMLQATLELLAEVGFERMTMDAIAMRAKIGKNTIYRRYTCKEELVADAIETMRSDVLIPDTGNLWTDIDLLIDNAAEISFSPLGRQTIAMIISSAASNSEFARIYDRKYLNPRRQVFAIVIERAKERNEVDANLDPALIFDTMGGIMLHALLFPPPRESWQDYVRRALYLLLSPGRDNY